MAGAFFAVFFAAAFLAGAFFAGAFLGIEATNCFILEPLFHHAAQRHRGARFVVHPKGDAVVIAEIVLAQIAVKMSLLAMLVDSADSPVRNSTISDYSLMVVVGSPLRHLIQNQMLRSHSRVIPALSNQRQPHVRPAQSHDSPRLVS